jgi:anti-sigma-K factor RskA
VEQFDLMDHEFEELLPAYALGALEPEKRGQLEVHLESCEQCQANLASYRLIGEGLLHSSDPVRPPTTLRTRVLRQINSPAELPFWKSAFQNLPVTKLGFAIGAVLLLIVSVGSLLQAQRLLDQGHEAYAQQQAGQTAIALASYPSSQVVVIEEDGVRGTFVYDPGLPIGVMYVWGLQRPLEDQAYQAWLIDPQGQRLNGGLLTFSEDPGFGWVMIEAPTTMSEFSSLGVTLEPAGGSLAPTGPRILGADL